MASPPAPAAPPGNPDAFDPSETRGRILRRLVAFAIDFFIAWALAWLIFTLLGEEPSVFGPDDGRPFFWTLWGLLILTVTFEQAAFGGVTAGKALTGVRTVMMDGRRVSLGRSFLRSVLLTVDMLMFVGVIVAASTPPRQARIGDYAAGTWVKLRDPSR